MFFVLDRNKSIWNAVASVYPRFSCNAYIYILWTNVLKKTQKNIEEVRKLFLSLTKTYTIEEFEELMSRKKEISSKCHPYLIKVDFKKWSRAHSTVKRTWTLISNIAESINNAILHGRRLLVVPMLEYMRITIET